MLKLRRNSIEGIVDKFSDWRGEIMNNILDSKFIKMLYEYYKNTDPNKKTPFTKQVMSNLSKEQLDILGEYNILFKSLYFSPILKNLGIEFNDLNLSNIIKCERPDFKLNHNGNIIGIEIKDIRLHDNIANRTIDAINNEVDVEHFLQQNDREKIVNKVTSNDKGEVNGYMSNFMNLDKKSVLPAIQKTDEAIIRTNKFELDKYENMFLAIRYSNEINFLNLLTHNDFNKYENIEYKNAEESLMILKVK